MTPEKEPPKGGSESEADKFARAMRGLVGVKKEELAAQERKAKKHRKPRKP